MKHSYILQEASWKAIGVYYDSAGNQFEVYGETAIKHFKDEWVLDGFMEVKLDNPVRFFNKYSITPLPVGKDFTDWTSQNPALGKLIGKFMIIGDTILSSYSSENGLYSGSECLVLLDNGTYHNRGFAFNGDRKLSSWEVTLQRV